MSCPLPSMTGELVLLVHRLERSGQAIELDDIEDTAEACRTLLDRIIQEVYAERFRQTEGDDDPFPVDP